MWHYVGPSVPNHSACLWSCKTISSSWFLLDVSNLSTLFRQPSQTERKVKTNDVNKWAPHRFPLPLSSTSTSKGNAGPSRRVPVPGRHFRRGWRSFSVSVRLGDVRRRGARAPRPRPRPHPRRPRTQTNDVRLGHVSQSSHSGYQVLRGIRGGISCRAETLRIHKFIHTSTI